MAALFEAADPAGSGGEGVPLPGALRAGRHRAWVGSGLEGGFLSLSNPRKGPPNLRIDDIEPENFGVFGETFTDSIVVSGGVGRFLRFGNEIFCFGGWKLALLCNGRVDFGLGKGRSKGAGRLRVRRVSEIWRQVSMLFLEVVSYGGRRIGG